MMKGRPILGTVAGFMLGLFGGLALILYGVVPLHSDLVWILPLVGIVLGLVLAAWAPFGSDPKVENAPAPRDPDDAIVDGDPPAEIEESSTE